MLTGFYDKIVIADTSCLIAFTNIRCLNLLQTLCSAIITTPEVAVEYRDPLRYGLPLGRLKTKPK
jgi:predicted nucleic acid-binding protein